MRGGHQRRNANAYTARQRWGIALIVASCVLYALIIVVPFLPFDTHVQVLIGAGLVILGEGTFWIGCVIAGKDFMTYLRKKLWPTHWRRKAAAR